MNNDPIFKPCCPVMPAQVVAVESVASVRQFTNAIVQVTSINSTYYVDSKHRPALIYAAPLFIDGYNYQANPLKLRSQTVYDFTNNRAIVYSPTGKYKLIKLEEN